MPDEYPLPEGLARLAKRKSFAPNELREACRSAGERLGREDAREARFRSAAEMVEMWWGLDLPAWVAPYALRDARLGYLAGYGEALISGELQGGGWTKRRERAGVMVGRRSSRRPAKGAPATSEAHDLTAVPSLAFDRGPKSLS
jgi:hypothetical protein